MTQVKSMSFASQQANFLRAHATASQFDPHLHSTHSIVALKRGSAEIKSARWSDTVRAGDVFFFNPYEVHSALCCDQDVEYDTLYPSEEFLRKCLGIECSDVPLRIHTTILRRRSITRELIDALDTPAEKRRSIEASLGRMLTACVFSTGFAEESSAELARRACMLIQKNCTRAMRTEELAREMGVHKSHLVRVFSTAVGMAPQKYMRQVRVAKATELIAEGFPLTDVALMLNFSDQAHFTREFKKVFGVPPGALSRDIGGCRRKNGDPWPSGDRIISRRSLGGMAWLVAPGAANTPRK